MISTHTCPFCAEPLSADAAGCRYCGGSGGDSRRDRWLYLGVALLIALCSSVLWSPSTTSWAPMPMHQLLLMWTTDIGFFVVLPALYVGATYSVWNNVNRGLWVLLGAATMAVATFVYFAASWDAGVRWQGFAHTLSVAVENVFALGVIMVTAVLGFRLDDRRLQMTTNLLVFAWLSWGAFPYLGEMS